MAMNIPNVEMPKQISLADAMQQWQEINTGQQRQKLAEMKANQIRQDQAQQDQLKGAFANGRPSAEQLYALDPEFAGNYEKQQMDIQGKQQEYDDKKHVALKNLATDAITKLEQSGIKDPAQAQQFITQYQHNMKPYIQKVLGLPGDADMTLEQVQQLAASSVGTQQDWIVANDAQRGSFMLNKKTGEVKPLEHGGQQIMPPQYSPDLQGNIAFERSRNTIKQATGPDMRDKFMTQGEWAGYGPKQPNGTPNSAQQPYIGISEDATPEDRAILEGIAKQTNGKITSQGPVMGPTPGEVETSKKNAPQQVENEQKVREAGPAQERVQTGIDDIKKALEDLDANNGVVNSKRGVIDNLQASASSSDLGQYLGHKVGSTNQMLREKIKQAAPLLMQQIAKASGMSSKQMDSNADIKMFMSAIANEQYDVEAGLSALKRLEDQFGINAKLFSDDGKASNLKFGSPNDVRGALKAGLIDKQNAHRILVDQFGFEDE